MNEWIKFADKKPDTDIIALVFNENGFMCGGNVVALYSKHYDVWRLYDMDYREGLTLDVTHYLPVPPTPPLK